ncbi:MAG: esterase, partial [Verrucomicrobiales bacterium]|nr:esterase [Verrucomicrobiales bacterium]
MDIQRLQERLNVIFEKNFKERDELGASVSVWFEGQEIVSLAGGFCDKEKSREWDERTLVPVWSATKGLASVCFLKVLHSHGISLDSNVVGLWPEFGH